MYSYDKMKEKSFKEREIDITSGGLKKPKLIGVRLEKISIPKKAKELKETHFGFDIDYFDIKDLYNERGLYSTKFGVSPFDVKKANFSSYHCLCGELIGNIHENEICETCGYKVTNTPDLRKTGIIKLKDLVISPASYGDFVGLIGRVEFQKILKFDETYDIQGKIEEKKKKKYHGIGLRRFIENYKEIIDFYLNKTKRKNFYNQLIKNEDSLFTDIILVYSALLRPNLENRDSDVINHNRQLFETNKDYETIMKSIEGLDSIRDHEDFTKFKESFLYDIQMSYVNIYEALITEWKEKGGSFRGMATSPKIDYSARAVIVPDNTLDLDEVSLPYIIVLTFLDLKIMKILMETTGITIEEASDILFRATIKFDKRIYRIINHIIYNSEERPRVLINRPPSLNPESIRLVKFRCKDNLESLTMGKPVALLPGFSGDFDGDTLLIIMIHFKSLMKAFSALDPSHQLISRVDGKYNRDYLFIKDMAVGFSMLYENSKGEVYYKKHPDEIAFEDDYNLIK